MTASHAHDVGGTVIFMELKAIRSGMFHIREEVLKEMDVRCLPISPGMDLL